MLLQDLLDESVRALVRHQAPTGAYVASPTFPNYRYSWLRDGAFIADAASRVGAVASADAFHTWVADVVTARTDRITRLLARHAAGDTIDPEEHLHTRYTVDGAEVADDWWNFQLDGYGTWLWALTGHLVRHDRDPVPYLPAIDTLVPYLAAFWDQPSYDWWEEHLEHRHTASIASLAGGLAALATLPDVRGTTRQLATSAAAAAVERVHADGVVDGVLTKWFGSTAVDASLLAAFVPFRVVDPTSDLAVRTVARIEAELAPAGVHRYLDDVYYGGGQWVLLAGFLGWYHAEVGDHDRARALLTWMVAQAAPDGALPEQVAVDLLHPEHEQRWIERWGPSASPLLWSHAMLLTLADALGERPDPTVVRSLPAPTAGLVGVAGDASDTTEPLP